MTAIPFDAALAAVAPSLGTAQSFAVLGGQSVTNTNSPTIITGDLGVSPGTSVTNFPPGIVLAGTIHSADAVALQAQNDTTTAFNNLAGQACNFDLTGQDLGGMTLVAGVYCYTSSAQLTGTLTLDGQGDPNSVWVFKTVSGLNTASSSSVLLINEAQQCNVFWKIGSSATLGTSNTFVGNIIALTSISLATNTNLSGRALARNGSVTLDSNAVAFSACAVPPVTPIPPTLGKAFNPATVGAGGTSTLTITLSNPDATVATLTAPLIDTLPAGVVVAATPNASTTCVGGSVTAVAGSSTVTLSTGAQIPASGGSCTVTVDVTAASGGSYINTLPAGALKTGNGNNVAPAIATLTVTPPANGAPTLGKAFSPATIGAGSTSTLTITLSNPANTIATLTAPLIDTLPAGVVVATIPNASTTCASGTVTAAGGGSTVTLSTGAKIPANGSCTVTVDVTAPVGGNYINTLAAGALVTSNGNNVAPAIATLTVTPPANVLPTLSKSFSPATINAGGTSTLTITLGNANATIATLTAPLIDHLPIGVVVAATPNASTTCLGGTVTAAAGSSTVTLSTGAQIPANGSCTVSVDVTANASCKGIFYNKLPAGALQTNRGSNAAPAVATLTVKPFTSVPPTLSKSFSPATIAAGGTSTLTITLGNANATIATLTAPLIDYLPIGVVVANSPNASTTCLGGTVTAVAGGSKVTLSTGAQIPANGSCTVKVNVTANSSCKGYYYNTLPSGALKTNLGSNIAAAVATLTVKSVTSVPPKLGKAFSPSTITAGGTSTLTIGLGNANATVATLTAPLTDYLPFGLVVSNSPNASTTCLGGTVTAAAGSSKVTLSAGSQIPANGFCTVKVQVTATPTCKGNYYNTLPAGALKTNLGNNVFAAVATLTVNPKRWW